MAGGGPRGKNTSSCLWNTWLKNTISSHGGNGDGSSGIVSSEGFFASLCFLFLGAGEGKNLPTVSASPTNGIIGLQRRVQREGGSGGLVQGRLCCWNFSRKQQSSCSLCGTPQCLLNQIEGRYLPMPLQTHFKRDWIIQDPPDPAVTFEVLVCH